MTYGVFTWNGVDLDIGAIAEQDRENLIRIQLKHKFSNEVSANVGRLREKAKAEADKAGEEFDVVEFDEATTKSLQEKMRDRFLDGTIGIRVGGPRGSTIENIAWDLAMKQAQTTLAPKGYWPMPTKDIKAEDATIEFDGQAMTREDLTDMVFEKYKDRFLTEAKAVHAERLEKAKLNKANKVTPVAKVTQSAADLI